jgi:hypothetical protein
MDMRFKNMTSCPPLYVAAAVLLTLVFPLLAIRPLRRVGRSHWQVGPLLVALPIVGNAAVSYLLLRQVIIRLAVIGHPSSYAAAEGVGGAQRPLLMGATASVVTAAIGLIVLWRGARIGQEHVAERSLLRGSICAVLTMCLVVVAGVFMESFALIHSSVQLVLNYYLLSAASAICALVVLAIVVQLVALSRGTSARSPAPSGVFTPRPVPSLAVAGGMGAIIAIVTWLVQARYFHIAMRGGG